MHESASQLVYMYQLIDNLIFYTQPVRFYTKTQNAQVDTALTL